MSKRPRTLESFFSPPPTKKPRALTSSGHEAVARNEEPKETSNHRTYPFAIPWLPTEIIETLNFAPAEEGRIINDMPDLDLLYYQPYISGDIESASFNFLRRELFFYRVRYNIKRGPTEMQINTPRYTTVFGLDESSRFNEAGDIVDAGTGRPVPTAAYKCKPRPIPECLDLLRRLTENATGCKFNFALVNYYATGDDSISYHSDDERFLGAEPAIASFSLGAQRDFFIRHKKPHPSYATKQNIKKFTLASGEMLLMRGKTQSKWEHSIPKRKGGDAEKGRINITFRRAMVKGGTENYYRYNVGDGDVFKWDDNKREMTTWTASRI